MLQELSFTIGQPSTGYRTLDVHASNPENINVRIVRDGFRTSLPAPSTPDAAWLARADAVLPAEPPPMKRCHKLSSLSWQLRYTTDENSDFLMRQGVFPACWNDFIDWLADITPALDWSSYRLPVRQPGEFIVCGVVFHGMMQRLNREGWDIRVTTPMNGTPKAYTGSANIIRQYLILGIVMDNGKHYLSSVNPKFARSLNLQLQTAPHLKQYAWFTTSDRWFEDFPKVRSLRGRPVSATVYHDKTAAMQPVKV